MKTLRVRFVSRQGDSETMIKTQRQICLPVTHVKVEADLRRRVQEDYQDVKKAVRINKVFEKLTMNQVPRLTLSKRYRRPLREVLPALGEEDVEKESILYRHYILILIVGTSQINLQRKERPLPHRRVLLPIIPTRIRMSPRRRPNPLAPRTIVVLLYVGMMMRTAGA